MQNRTVCACSPSVVGLHVDFNDIITIESTCIYGPSTGSNTGMGYSQNLSRGRLRVSPGRLAFAGGARWRHDSSLGGIPLLDGGGATTGAARPGATIPVATFSAARI